MNLVPQFGFLELILIAVVALVVVGPRDLPRLMRQAGRLVAKAKSMAHEFTSAFDQMARETEMDELRKEIEALRTDNAVARAAKEMKEAVSPLEKELADEAQALKHSTPIADKDEETDHAASDVAPEEDAAAAKS